jgi:hypothetical protein
MTRLLGEARRALWEQEKAKKNAGQGTTQKDK